MLRFVNARVPSFRAVDDPLIAVPNRRSFHMRCIRTVVRLSDTKGKTCTTLGQIVDPSRLLLVGAVLDHQQQAHIVAHDGVLVLQIVMQAKAHGGEMLTNDGHTQVGALLAAIFLR